MYREWIDFGAALHLLGVDQHLLSAVLVLAGLASAGLVALALVALVRRRSLSYALVTLALATLLVRTLVGMLTLGDRLDAMPHHVLEHGLDVLTVLLLLAAVYCARTVDRTGDELGE